MESTRRSSKGRDSSGIALFMVIAAMSVLSILVTEFTYIAQVNQTMAFDGLDQLKAHYLAKGGLKLSLLRLKAYQQVKGVASQLGGGAGGAIPRSVLEKIWSFPFFYPIPTNIPGMSPSDKEKIEKFQNASGLEGKFSAVIDSESSKYNLNLILANFVPSPSPSASGSPSPPPATGTQPNPNPSPSTSPSFNPDEARQSLTDYFNNILTNRIQTDEQFAHDYQGFRLEDFMDGLFAWADVTYQRRNSGSQDPVPMKQGPFTTVQELHMLPMMDDELYDLFTPALTASTTPGINVNTMQEPTLRALIPLITKDEVTEFFKFRDSETDDNQFKSADDFYKYLQNNVAVFKNDPNQIQTFKDSLTKRNIRIVTDETQFKITVTAQMNQATRVIEAWVTLGAPAPNPNQPNPGPSGAPAAGPPSPNGVGPNGAPTADAGLKITFMRIL